MTTPVIQDLYKIAKEDGSDVKWNDSNDGFIIHIQNDNHWISVKEIDESVVYQAPLIKRDFLPQLLEIAIHEQLNTTLSFAMPLTQEDEWVYLQGVHDIHSNKSKNIKRYQRMRASFQKDLLAYYKLIQQISDAQQLFLDQIEKDIATVTMLDKLQTDINQAVNVLERTQITTSYALKSFEKSMRAALSFHRATNQRLTHALIDKLLESVHETPSEELWEIIEDGLDFPPELDERMQTLIEYGKNNKLSFSQRGELDDLMDLYDKHVVLRAKTITELRERGEDILVYLKENKPE